MPVSSGQPPLHRSPVNRGSDFTVSLKKFFGFFKQGRLAASKNEQEGVKWGCSRGTGNKSPLHVHPCLHCYHKGVPSNPHFFCLKIPLHLYAKLLLGTHRLEEMSSGPLGITDGAIRRKSSSSAMYPRCERGKGIASLSLCLRTQWICSGNCLD